MQGRLSPTIDGILARMRKVADIQTAPFDGSDEWLKLTAPGVVDYALFQKIRFQWPMISGIHMDKVALVHCKSEPHAGLWLHDLSGAGMQAMYEAGCHEVATWNQPAPTMMSSPMSGFAGARA